MLSSDLKQRGQYPMIKKISLFSLFYFAAISHSIANNHLILPEKTISYLCTCSMPNAQGICHAYQKDGVKRSAQSTPTPLTLPGGWIIQPINCVSKQQYTLKSSAVLFSGKKIVALYDKLKSPLSNIGYVYHVTPNLPYTQANYSMIVINNPAIHGIDLKNSQWQCGSGNSRTSCHSHWRSARCFSGNTCDFTYSDQ
jgi:hypothetical protein